MKTTLLKTLAAIAFLLCSITVFAEDFEVDGIYYYIRSETEKTVVVTSRYGGYTGSVVIPETVTYSGTKYSVTSIGAYAFSGDTGLREITIPNSVTSIGYAAFSYCTGLAEVTIPNSVTSIGDGAFSNCDGLTSVTIPNRVTSIGGLAFYYCTGLTEVTIPNSVTTIGESAFDACYGLTEVTIPSSVTSIGDYTFYDCTGLRTVTIGSGVQEIGNYAFDGCDKIKDVYTYPTVPPTIYTNTFTFRYYENNDVILHTVKGYKDVYAEAPYWEYFTNITDDLTSVEGVKADEAFSVTVVGGTLAIAGAADNAVVNIYNTNGALLHHTTVAQASGIALPNGIYLVQVNGVTQKVAL